MYMLLSLLLLPLPLMPIKLDLKLVIRLDLH